MALAAGAFWTSTADAQQAYRPWAVDMYLNADNDLEKFIVKDFLEVAVSPNKNDGRLGVLAQLDRTGKHYPDSDPPDSPTTLRFVLSDPGVESASASLGLATPNSHDDMSQAATIADFLSWAQGNRSATSRALIVSSHGTGPKGLLSTPSFSVGPAAGIAGVPGAALPLPTSATATEEPPTKGLLFDETANRHMFVEEFAEGVRKGRGTKKIDVIGLDACLMSTIEVAYALRSEAELLVASEEEEIESGWDHSVWFKKALGVSTLSREQLSDAFIDSYKASLKSDGFLNANTIATVRLPKIVSLAARIADLATDLVKNWAQSKVAVVKARQNCRSFGRNMTANTVDIGCFVSKLSSLLPSENPAKTLATSVLEAVCEPIKGSTNCGSNGVLGTTYIGKFPGSSLGPNYGLSIYFPATRAQSGTIKGVSFDEYRASTQYKLTFLTDYPIWLQFLSLYLATD